MTFVIWTIFEVMEKKIHLEFDHKNKAKDINDLMIVWRSKVKTMHPFNDFEL